MTEPGTAAGPKPAELLGAKHDDPDPTGPLTDYESVPDTAARQSGASRVEVVMALACALALFAAFVGLILWEVR